MSGIVDSSGQEYREEPEVYEVLLTAQEMQHIANGLAAFMTVMHQREVQISPEQIMSLISAMDKFKASLPKKSASEA